MRAASVISPSFRRRDRRGILVEMLNDGRWASVLCGRMKAGAVMGNHYHKRTEVFFFLTSGSAEVVCRPVGGATPRSRRCAIRAHEGVWLRAGTAHAIRFTRPSAFVMLKSRRYRPSQPDTYASFVLNGASA